MASLGLNPNCDGHCWVRVSARCSLALCEWKRSEFLSQGVVIVTIQARKVITTEASLGTLGATHEGRTVSGTWGPHMCFTHINYLGMQAGLLALKHFLPWLKGHHVINRLGVLRSSRLHTGTQTVSLEQCASDIVALFGCSCTRHSQLWGRSHSMQIGDFTLLWRSRFGHTSVRRQWTFMHQCRTLSIPSFLYTIIEHYSGWTLAHNWRRTLLNTFHPVGLIPATLARVKDKGLSVILVTLCWPGKHWLRGFFAGTFQCMSRPPWPLSVRRDLLSQARGEKVCSHTESLALWTWSISYLT